ncbi:MAG: hypothetical protein ACJAYE_003738 [Candidatus Azotimanducaceae bacterium]|jgi:hypothetical protein
MLTIALIVLLYFTVSFISLYYLMRRCAFVQSENRRIFAKSLCFAIFFTPTISIPASLPVPAVSMLMVGLVGLVQAQGELVLAAALTGLLPIAVAAVLMFSIAKLIKLFMRLVNSVPSD